MNVYDSDRIASELAGIGYQPTEYIDIADLIILNTCSIREKAEHKVYSLLGRLAHLKQKKPDLIVGVGGCVAQQEGENIMQRAPFVDIVFGTHAINRLLGHIDKIEKIKCRVVDIDMTSDYNEFENPPHISSISDATRFVTIMQGCDNFCAYCVVPYVRGREKSRSPNAILKEIEALVNIGVREVTLLGQNVNSYGNKEGWLSFSELLTQINQIDGLYRIRFTTSHPKDLSDDLIQAFQRLDKLCNHIHLPVQSGSNAVLQKMNRKYTRETYLQKIDQLRQIRPDIAISSDIIVGFPGETPADFRQTIDLMNQVEFDSLFAFKYSDRPNVPAARLPDKVSEEEKSRRLTELLNHQEPITIRKNSALVGRTEWVLVEGFSKKQNDSKLTQWTGRTSDNKVVNFEYDVINGTNIVGKLIPVKIENAYAHSLWGTVG